MSVDRMTRVNELLKREVAEALYHVMDPAVFDMAAVTITRVETSRSLQQARVMVSVREHLAERGAMLHLLRRARGEIQAYVSSHVVLKYTPRLDFALDTSVERGDRILGLLHELRGPDDEDVDGFPPDEAPGADETDETDGPAAAPADGDPEEAPPL